MSDETSEKSGKLSAKRAFIALGVFLLLALLVFMLDSGSLYLWAKAVHVIAVISWMAGMLYLPRLYIYHVDSAVGSEKSETFKVMEARLMRIIMNPAMIVAWVLGLWLAWYAGLFFEIWFWVKFAGVVAMTFVHGSLARARKLFAEDRNEKTSHYWRMFNEVPTVLMILIVIMVIVRPF